MNRQTLLVTIGCLLHDIGKPVYRAGILRGTHSEAGAKWLDPLWTGDGKQEVLECVRYHHAAELKTAKIADDSIAYIAYIADNLSAAADRRENEGDAVSQKFGFDKPLSPVFTHLNGEHTGKALNHLQQDGMLCMPIREDEARIDKTRYSAEILNGLKKDISSIDMGEEWIDSLLSILESWTSAIPSSTSIRESADISLYDHVKISAAIGACISEYVQEKNEHNYKKALMSNERKFKDEPTFILYSADFSGIQKFIFTVSTQNALRALRSRSFFLEMAMEHYIDELLSGCGVSRANLLYSGGGHCYVLLPNSKKAHGVIETWNKRFNDWLLGEFGTSLYLADGHTICTGNELTNTPAEKQLYKGLFRRVSKEISKKKLARYSAEQIQKLNAGFFDETGRECRICGRIDHLKAEADGEICACSWCNRFEKLANPIFEKNIFITTESKAGEDCFPVPTLNGDASIYLADETEARKRLASSERIIRIYTRSKKPIHSIPYSVAYL